MAMTWNEEEIKSSNTLTDIEKQILLDELNKRKSSINFFQASENYEKFRREYKKMDGILRSIGKRTYDYTENFYNKCLRVTDSFFPNISNLDINEEFVLENMSNFIMSLHDQDILKEYMRILEQRNLLNIQKRTDDNEAIEDFGGRCVCNDSSKDTHVSVYLNGQISDLTLLAHEIGHAIEHKLFFGKRHPITKYYLTETTSYLFELLMSHYITNYLYLPIAGESLMVNRTTATMDHAWGMKIQRTFYDLGEFNPEAVAKEMHIHGRMVSEDSLTIDNVTKMNKAYYSKLINSYLLALQLFTRIIESPISGFKLYKSIESDPEDNLDTLLQKYGIDYTRDENNYASMYNASKELSMTLVRRV